ncbi:MAG: hypothetical protein LUC91_08690 [Prevotella sp.]|nr:hypothetical protein [Prevotella sp.]
MTLHYGIYYPSEIETVNKKYWNNAPRTEIDPLLDKMKERFCNLEKEDKVKCKSAIKTYIRTYEFLSTIMPTNSLEWEKKETVLKLLLNKLPSLGMDDLTQGLLESVDFDRYRLEKKEERAIQLKNTDTEIEPVPTSPSNNVGDPDMQPLSEIEKNFNKMFGNIDWKADVIVREQVGKITELVINNDTVRNSMLNSDEDTANQDCDQQVATQMSKITASSTELMAIYWQREDFRKILNDFVREKVRKAINPEYDEDDLKERMREEFQNDFADICDGVNYVKFDEVLKIFFGIVNAKTIPDLQDLKSKLRHILNCLYRAQHRDVDFRTWYTQLVTRFDTFLKKIYWLTNGTTMPLNANGEEPSLRETITYFPKLATLYNTPNERYANFRKYYRSVFSWLSNNEASTSAEHIPSELLPSALHAAVALYLYTTMACADSVKDKV